MSVNKENIKMIFCRPADERALLAFCFKDIEKYYSLLSQLSQNDFLHPDHNTLFSILSSLHGKNARHFDFPLVIKEAQENGCLESIGGIDYIKTIKDMEVNENNYDMYLNNVLESNLKYRLYLILYNGIIDVEQNSKDDKTGNDLISKVESGILDLSTESKAIKEPIDISYGLKEEIEQRKVHQVKIMGVSTGYPILDNQIDGLVAGTLTAITARPKMGKSAFLSNVAAHVAFRENIPVLYVDTEMTFSMWRDRILSLMSGIEERVIKHGGYDDDSYQKLIKCISIIEKGKLFHEFMPGYSIDKLTALYKKYYLKHGIGLIIFDYVKEPNLASISGERKEYQILGDVVTKLKDLSGQLNIPALVAAQINRDGDIADSDRIARYADVICQWSKKENKEYEEAGSRAGTHKLVIRETRRGGMTSKLGIGYNFYVRSISIKEVALPDQAINDYAERVVNYGSADDDLL